MNALEAQLVAALRHLARVAVRSVRKAAADAGGWVQRWRVPAVCLVLAAITFAVFAQTTGFGFVNYDDFTFYENTQVAGGLSLKGLAGVFTHADGRLFYHPLTMLSFMADHQLYGLQAGGYHLTNVLLHTASVILLFLILRQMTGAFWRSAFVAAVFAIHPLRVQSVAWVAERKDVLSAFFFMLTLGAYARYVRKPNSLGRYLMVALAYVLALLSKPSVVTLPFVLLLLDYWPLHRFEASGPVDPPKYFGIPRRLILEKIPLLALAAGACAINVLVTRGFIVPAVQVSMPSRIGNALVYYAVYLRQMIWPEGLAVVYPYPPNGLPPWEMALAGVLLGGLSAVAWRGRLTQPWLLIGWLWYLGMLVPMIGIVQAGAYPLADRYTYLPQIGIYMAVTWLVAEWWVSRVALGGLMAVVLVTLMVCAWIQTGYWQDSETLWSHTLACTTSNYVAHIHLGIALEQKGILDEAAVHYQEALKIDPDKIPAHNNIANFLVQKGGVDEAISQYQKALQIKPDYEVAHYNLASALLQKGREDEAIAQFQNVLQINPDNAAAHYNLASALLQRGNVTEAIAHFQQAMQIEPADPWAKNKLAWLMATCPQASLRNGNEAVELAAQADELAGGENPVILHTLAAAFAEAGRFSEAVKTAQRALRLAEAQSNTGLAAQLQSEIKLYQAGSPLHIPAQKH